MVAAGIVVAAPSATMSRSARGPAAIPRWMGRLRACAMVVPHPHPRHALHDEHDFGTGKDRLLDSCLGGVSVDRLWPCLGENSVADMIWRSQPGDSDERIH